MLAQPYFPIRLNDRWGAIDVSGKIVMQPKYDRVDVEGEKNNFLVAKMGDSTFLINSRLKIVARTKYSIISEYGGNVFQTAVRPDNPHILHGLLDSTGGVLLEPKFDFIGSFQKEEAAIACFYPNPAEPKEGTRRCGLIDKKGTWVVQPHEGADFWDPNEGLVSFYRDDEGWGAMNYKGEIVIQPKYSVLRQCRFGYFEYSLTGLEATGLISRTGKVTISSNKFDALKYYPTSAIDTLVIVHTFERVDGVATARILETNIYTVHGKFVFKSPFKKVINQINGDFSFLEDNKWGLMDANGKILVKPIYNGMFWTEKGLTKVERNGKYGYINRNGEEVIPCIYDGAEPFKNGLAKVFVGGDYHEYEKSKNSPNVTMGYIDIEGNFVWKPTR